MGLADRMRTRASWGVGKTRFSSTGATHGKPAMTGVAFFITRVGWLSIQPLSVEPWFGLTRI